jgi:hypothetical protein
MDTSADQQKSSLILFCSRNLPPRNRSIKDRRREFLDSDAPLICFRLKAF